MSRKDIRRFGNIYKIVVISSTYCVTLSSFKLVAYLGLGNEIGRPGLLEVMVVRVKPGGNAPLDPPLGCHGLS